MRKVGVNFYETFFQNMTHYGAVCFDMEKKSLKQHYILGQRVSFKRKQIDMLN